MAKHCRLAVINGHGDFRYGDCQITAAELAGSMATMGHRFTYHELAEIMSDVDSNGDSVMRFITKERKSSSKPAKFRGGTQEKAITDKLRSEAPMFVLTKPSILADRLFDIGLGGA
ncbi:EF-hand domain pair protein [Raphanus sativus]|nr:EF-hand domain pair protein [Raphanus sativus]